MMHLTEWILTAVAGPVLVVCIVGMYRFSGRINGLESRMGELERRVVDDVHAREDGFARNDAAHLRIEVKIEKTAEEWRQELKDLKADLIREFHAANGSS